jgi:hypothetical protein
MPINKNHEFEEINGIKCSIVEKNADEERVKFLKDLLEFNGFTVVVAPTPVKPAPPPKPPAAGEALVEQPPAADTPPPPETFTVGVTHVAFNPTNAIFGRLLRNREGNIVTLAYWQQKEAHSSDDVPYFESGKQP